MDIWHAVILGIVEGISEFLPISSTAHLRIASGLLGYQPSDSGLTAFVTVIQAGAILAVLVYLWRDICRAAVAWVRGFRQAKVRRSADYRLAWFIVIGSLPVALIGIMLRDLINTSASSLMLVPIGLLAGSLLLLLADRYCRELRRQDQLNWGDALFVGAMQCLALIPGFSRSGATISAGLFRGFDRVMSVKLAFLLGVPAILSAGSLELLGQSAAIDASIGWAALAVGVGVAFVVGLVAIRWLLRHISTHSFTPFVVYRLLVALAIIAVSSI